MEELLSFWFGPVARRHHFNQSDEFDQLITEKYEKMLTSHVLPSEPSKNDFMASVILFDQIPRHIFRTFNTESIKEYHAKIVAFVTKYYQQIKHELNANEFSFALLPLRHTNDFNYMCVVLRETWIRIQNDPDEPQYKRFLESTYKRYLNFNNDNDNLLSHHIASGEPYNSKYLDAKCASYDHSHMVESQRNPIIDAFIKKYDITECIISLSGGVDSMVLAYYLKNTGIEVYALHINYLNRPDCINEEEIIINWTSKMGIPLFIRQIDEIKRKQCMDNNLRELYEEYTRNIRFQSYRNVMTRIGKEMCVFLGHNKDDCYENILTNIASKSHYDNLQGMSELIEQGDITFARPMLTIEKKEIYDMASYIHIPYFVDSTPKWSQRGKIRDIVRPTLESWNPSMVDSMFHLSDSMGQLMAFVADSAQQFVENYKLNNFIKIKINEINTNQIYWNLILQKLNIYISCKSLNEFIWKMTYVKSNCKTFAINEKHKHMLNKNYHIEYYLEKEKNSIRVSFIKH